MLKHDPRRDRDGITALDTIVAFASRRRLRGAARLRRILRGHHSLVGTGDGALPSSTVVKLDVEGFEVEVLRGFGAMLADPALRAVVFEAPGAVAAKPERSPVVRMLTEFGFAVDALPPAHRSEKSVATNFLATRR